jgi:hypothetical protein
MHSARDGAVHNQIVNDILRDHGAKSLIKSKLMLTEGLNPVKDATHWLRRRKRRSHPGNRDRSRGAHPAAR